MKRRKEPHGLPGQYDAQGRKLFADDCPVRYTGPIERADGRRPYNGYLWPTESWWAYHEAGKRVWDSRIRICIVHLWDGCWAVDGFVWQIQKDSRRFTWEATPEQLPRRNCFATRREAIRTAAADTLRMLRSARRWDGHMLSRDPVHWAEAVNWVIATAHREADRSPPTLQLHRDPPPPPVRLTGMPLFDHDAKPPPRTAAGG